MTDSKTDDLKVNESANQQTVTIDDVKYNVADLSDEAKNQMVNIRVTDEEIRRLQQRMAIAQTARVSYARALVDILPEPAKD